MGNLVCGGGASFQTKDACFNGIITGFNITSGTETVAREDLSKKTIFDAMALRTSNRAYTFKNAPTTELIASEVVGVSWDNKADTQIGTKQGGLTFHAESNCSTKSILGLSGQTAYAYLLTDKNNVIGIGKDVGRNISRIKVNISAIEDANDKMPIIKVTLTFVDDYAKEKLGVAMESGFTISDISSADKFVMTDVTASTSEVKFTPRNECISTPITDMDLSGFGFYDETAGAVVTPDSVAVVGTEIVATFTTTPLVSTNVIKVTYTAVSISETDLYDAEYVSVTVA